MSSKIETWERRKPSKTRVVSYTDAIEGLSGGRLRNFH